MDPEGIESAIGAFFAEDPRKAVAVYLYGSVARGDCRADSDVDVGVLFATEPPLSLEGMALDLEAELERTLGAPVQIVVLDRAPVDLVHRVLRDGKLLLDLDPSSRIRFEVRKRNEYFDLLPHLDRYRRIERRVS